MACGKDPILKTYDIDLQSLNFVFQKRHLSHQYGECRA